VSEGVFAAARRVRPYLSELVGPDARDFDAQLARVLNEERPGLDSERRVRELLGRRLETSMFLEAVLDDEPFFRPPKWRTDELKAAGYAPPPGSHRPPPADLFRCPRGDFEFLRPDVGSPVPECPSHHGALARV
jgi:hypothetical protein